MSAFMLYRLSQPCNQALFMMGISWVSSDDRVYQIPRATNTYAWFCLCRSSSISSPKRRHMVITPGGNIKPSGLPSSPSKI